MLKINGYGVALGSLVVWCVAQAGAEGAAGPGVDQLLMAGRYSEIPRPRGKDSHAHAVWAFARYHLAPDQAAARSARLAHKKSDDLGTFVLMLCHRSGTGLLRDRAEAVRLNFELRSRLENKANPAALELYMLSHCQPGDRAGRLRDPDVEKLFAELNRQKKLRWERLQKAADLGFAQACQEVALAQENRAEAYRWHRKAADLGLAEGMRYAGLDLVSGHGVARDAAKGYELTLKAARKGDVYAMINLAVFYHRGTGVKKDPQQTRHWLDEAARSGHWYGCVEEGMALLTGDYGCALDRRQGVRLLQQAIATGNGDAFRFIAAAYAKGVGLQRDGKRAVRFAQAAYRQGSAEAAAVLAFIYAEGVGEVKADEDAAAFWGREADQPGFGVRLLGEKERADFLRQIDAINPFSLRVE